MVEAQRGEIPGALTGTLHTARTNAWFLGGGKAVINALYVHAEKLGIQFQYNAEVIGLDIIEGKFRSATVRIGHLGRVNIQQRLTLISAFEFILKEMGVTDGIGQGLTQFFKFIHVD